MRKSIEQMRKAINVVRKKYDSRHSHYEMSVLQMQALAEGNGKFQMMVDTFDYGFYMGIKFQQNQDKKKKAPVTDQSTKGHAKQFHL